MVCPQCGLTQPSHHRFCPECGTALPEQAVPHRAPKVSRWFWSIPIAPGDDPSTAVRASCYLHEFEMESDGHTVRVPNHHVRLSIWVGDRAVATASLPDDEARALAEFVLDATDRPPGLAPMGNLERQDR